jgi:hypothetical protein
MFAGHPGLTFGRRAASTSPAANGATMFWADFARDPARKKISADSQEDGRMVVENGVVSVLPNATDSSKIK